MVVRRNLIGWSGQSFRLSSNLLQPPQILNTTQRDQPNQGNQTPTTTDREGFREGRESQDGLERRIGLWGERGVLRVGMVSEGGEYGSQGVTLNGYTLCISFKYL